MPLPIRWQIKRIAMCVCVSACGSAVHRLAEKFAVHTIYRPPLDIPPVLKMPFEIRVGV